MNMNSNVLMSTMTLLVTKFSSASPDHSPVQFWQFR